MEALLVIDIEKSYGWSIGSLDEEGQREIALSLQVELDKWRSAGKEVVFVMFPGKFPGQGSQTSRGNMPELLVRDIQNNSHFKPEICLACEYLMPLAEFLNHRHEPFEPVFFKTESDAFSNRDLAVYLASKGIRKVKLAGCMTNCCVMDTGIGAVEYGFDVELLSDCSFTKLRSDASKKEWVRRVSEYIPGRYRETLSVTVS